MLTTLLALLSSSGLGSIIGLAGGLLNRKVDLQAKRLDHEFEIKKLEAQKEFIKLEAESRVLVASEEKEAAGYAALGASYDFAKTSHRDGLVDKLTKTIRPLLTLAFFALTVYIFLQIHLLVAKTPIADTEILYSLYKQIIEWIFFQAGISIGWWFAMRPGKTPNFGGK